MSLLTQPEFGFDHLTNISYASMCSFGGSGGLGTPASATWPTASRAFLIPFSIGRPIIILNGWVMNGVTVSASYNIDIGIYDASGTLLGSTGGFAQGTASAMQVQAMTTNILLDAGQFYMALVVDNASATVYRSTSILVGTLQGCGMCQASTAYPLPATITFASLVPSYLPLFGISTRSIV